MLFSTVVAYTVSLFMKPEQTLLFLMKNETTEANVIKVNAIIETLGNLNLTRKITPKKIKETVNKVCMQDMIVIFRFSITSSSEKCLWHNPSALYILIVRRTVVQKTTVGANLTLVTCKVDATEGIVQLSGIHFLTKHRTSPERLYSKQMSRLKKNRQDIGSQS